MSHFSSTLVLSKGKLNSATSSDINVNDSIIISSKLSHITGQSDSYSNSILSSNKGILQNGINSGIFCGENLLMTSDTNSVLIGGMNNSSLNSKHSLLLGGLGNLMTPSDNVNNFSNVIFSSSSCIIEGAVTNNIILSGRESILSNAEKTTLINIENQTALSSKHFTAIGGHIGNMTISPKEKVLVKSLPFYSPVSYLASDANQTLLASNLTKGSIQLFNTRTYDLPSTSDISVELGVNSSTFTTATNRIMFEVLLKLGASGESANLNLGSAQTLTTSTLTSLTVNGSLRLMFEFVDANNIDVTPLLTSVVPTSVGASGQNVFASDNSGVLQLRKLDSVDKSVSITISNSDEIDFSISNVSSSFIRSSDKGDLLVGNANHKFVNLPIGNVGQTLTVVSSDTIGWNNTIVNDQVKTSDATITTISTVTGLSISETYAMENSILAIDSSDLGIARFKLESLYKTDSGGVLSLITSSKTLVQKSSDAISWDVSSTTSGNNIITQVTGSLIDVRWKNSYSLGTI